MWFTSLGYYSKSKYKNSLFISNWIKFPLIINSIYIFYDDVSHYKNWEKYKSERGVLLRSALAKLSFHSLFLLECQTAAAKAGIGWPSTALKHRLQSVGCSAKEPTWCEKFQHLSHFNPSARETPIQILFSPSIRYSPV